MAPKSTQSPRKAPGFAVSYMDRKVDPRRDFYRYATGNWVKTHPLPPDKSRYGSFVELAEWNLASLRKIAEECSTDESIARGGVPAMVGKFYRSAMDKKTRQRAAFAPIDDMWKEAEGVSSRDDVLPLIRKLHQEGMGVAFQDFSKVDDRDSEVYAFFMWQGGLSLPDRDYYLSASFAKTRKDYLTHIEKTFRLKGFGSAEAKGAAQAVLRLETALAKASRSRTALRDPVKNYNRVEASELDAKYPHVAPGPYLVDSGIQARYVVVGQPEFFAQLDSLLSEGSVEDWRAYLLWSVLHAAASHLHREAFEENFDFFNRKLLGQKEPLADWKRALMVVDNMIGEALGSLYVAEYFPDVARKRAAELVQNLSEVFEGRLKSLPWMAESTRIEALEKFRRFRVKIGHPSKFRDYSSIRVEADDLVGNIRRASVFEFKREAKRVGGPVDKDEWFMTPPTVNAYFAPETNEIVFPAGILQPPFFDFKADDPVNYGGIGTVIGHEITHGYDDQGRQYDSKGNLRDWWTKDDEKAFKKRADEVVRVYSAQQVLPGLKLNGKLTLGENIADLGGVSIAYEALQRQMSKSGAPRKKIDALTPEQRFFVSWCQIWRSVTAKQESRRLVTIDPHSPGKFRGTIPAINHPAFDEAFPPKGKARAVHRIGVW